MARCRIAFEEDKLKFRFSPRKKHSNVGRRRKVDSELAHSTTFKNDENRFYVIEKLLGKRFTPNGDEEYLVRWKNYSPEWDSWEPRIELERNARDMILDFNNSLDRDKETLHCICRRPYRFEHGGMIQCFNCLEWFHFTCINVDMEEANSYAKYYCQACQRANPTFKNMIKPEKGISTWRLLEESAN